MMEENSSQTCIEDLKKEYAAIPIPEELRSRVNFAVEQAKETQTKQRKEKYKMRITKIAKVTGATAAAFVLTVAVLANSSQNIAVAMEQVPVLGAITKVVTFRTYEDDRGNVSAHIDVPQIEGGSEVSEVNNAIEQYTDMVIDQYEQDAAVMGEEGHYDLDLSHEVVTDNDSIFAIRFNQTLVMGSGNESVRIYNIDKETGKILSLGDLFQEDSNYLDILTKNIQEQMQQRMDADEKVYYWLHDEVEAWNFTQLSPDASFYVNKEGQLVIVFNEGDVAPMYMGVVEFTIPSDVTADIAQPGYLQ